MKNNYRVEFNYNVVHKRGRITGHSGNADIASDADLETFKSDMDLITFITQSVFSETGKPVLGVNILNVTANP